MMSSVCGYAIFSYKTNKAGRPTNLVATVGVQRKTNMRAREGDVRAKL
jgi:hypothetical protein